VTNGRIVGNSNVALTAACVDGYHNLGTFNNANGEQPIQLCNPNSSKCATDFADTPNPGGEYKAWLTPVANYTLAGGSCSSQSNVTFGFCDSDSKTDNFKIRNQSAAYVTVCKFNDQDGDGIQDTTNNIFDPFIAGWPVTATGVDDAQGNSGSVTADTDQNGCVSFAVTHFPASVTWK